MSIAINDELMACFVELSSNKERSTLEQSVVKSLCQLLDCDIRLLQLYNSRGELSPKPQLKGQGGGQVSFYDTNAEPLDKAYIERIKHYLGALKSSRPEAIYQQGNEVFWPLFSQDVCVDLLVLDLDCSSAFDLKLLDAIGCIFSNFVALLDASERDALTGLYNRRMFDTQLSNLVRSTVSSYKERSKERRHLDADSVLGSFLGIIDIDFFKRVNDDFGHLFGDEVLLWLAQNMRHCFRNEDALFRYGGEEFAVLLTGLSQLQAMETFERFRATIESTRFPQVGNVTVSIGFSCIDKQANPTLVFGDADKALYYAKEHGRNQVQCYEFLIENQLLSIEDADNDDIELF